MIAGVVVFVICRSQNVKGNAELKVAKVEEVVTSLVPIVIGQIGTVTPFLLRINVELGTVVTQIISFQTLLSAICE